MLGLPHGIGACLFDLDGVLTDTAAVHAAAWAQTFDAFLEGRGVSGAFTSADYATYVDGKTRADGVRDFLASRGIVLPDGEPDDSPDADTVYGVGNRKNQALLKRIEQDGVRVFEGSRRYLEAVRAAGLAVAVVSSSANTAQVLAVTGLAAFIEQRVDGVTIRELGLAGKPAPDAFLTAADRVGVEPRRAAVFEDALAGVEAGRAGGFGAVVGVNRHDQADELRAHGATVVVADLAELLQDGR